MKKILLFILSACMVGCAAIKPRGLVQLTFTYIHKEDSISEVQARHGYAWYAANCKDLPDTVKLGTVINAEPTKRPDTCKCVFRRIR